MFVIFIAGDAAAQIEIRRDGIEMILEKIGMLQHGGLDPFLVVIARLIAEPVRFPIDDIVAVFESEKEIDESSHESFHRPKMQTPQALWKFETARQVRRASRKISVIDPLQRGDRMGKFHFR